jgi:transcriptional regulator with XRE-family HTH domain
VTTNAGELLRTVRRRHGLTQRQLADRARTSQAAISRIERGTVSPTVETLTTLLDLMGEEIELDATPIDYGHDRTLNANNLVLTVEGRIHRQAAWGRTVREIQRGIRG